MNATLESSEVVTDASQPLVLSGQGYGLTIAPEYETRKSELLKSAGMILTVNDPRSDAAAADQISELAAMRIEVEKSRKIVKAPAIAFGADCDDKAKTFSADIVAEESRLKKSRGDYAVAVQQERNRVLAEMEKQRQAEAEKARLVEAARVLAEREAEEARRKAEELAFNATTPEEDEAAAKLAAEAAAADKERLRIAAEEAARVAALPVAAPAFVPEAPKGVKFEWDYVVTDAFALLNHNAGLVDLVPKRAAILERIKGMAIGDEAPVIPGLTISKVAKVSGR